MCILWVFTALYKRFDGIILPEHIKLPVTSGPGFWNYFPGRNQENPTTCDGKKLDSPDYNTKHLTNLNHQELRRRGMYMHLEDASASLVGKTAIEKLIDYIDTVCAVYKSLQSYYLCYKHYGYSDHKWTFTEFEKVPN